MNHEAVQNKCDKGNWSKFNFCEGGKQLFHQVKQNQTGAYYFRNFVENRSTAVKTVKRVTYNKEKS